MPTISWFDGSSEKRRPPDAAEIAPVIRPSRILDARVDAGRREEMLERILELALEGRFARVYFANVHMVDAASKDTRLREALDEADLVCPDGMPLVRLLQLAEGTTDRSEGMSVFPLLLSRAEDLDIPVALFGSTPAVLALVSDKIRQDHPGLRIVASIAPPFGPELALGEPRHHHLLRESGAKLVFVALGCPQQELWIQRVRNVPACFLGVGNALEVYVGLRKRAPQWARALALEWLFRLWEEPRRLAPRYFSSNIRFLLRLPGWIVFRPGRK